MRSGELGRPHLRIDVCARITVARLGEKLCVIDRAERLHARHARGQEQNVFRIEKLDQRSVCLLHLITVSPNLDGLTHAADSGDVAHRLIDVEQAALHHGRFRAAKLRVQQGDDSLVFQDGFGNVRTDDHLAYATAELRLVGHIGPLRQSCDDVVVRIVPEGSAQHNGMAAIASEIESNFGIRCTLVACIPDRQLCIDDRPRRHPRPAMAAATGRAPVTAAHRQQHPRRATEPACAQAYRPFMPAV